MKTAVSIPDDLFAQAEALASETKSSRSQLYACALREYVRRHAPERVTEEMDRVLREIDDPTDRFASRAGRRALSAVEW